MFCRGLASGAGGAAAVSDDAGYTFAAVGGGDIDAVVAAGVWWLRGEAAFESGA